MVDFNNSKTKENLARAFAGECQDGARYQFLATLAENEGYVYLKSILKTHAKNEMAHAKTYYTLLSQNCDVKQKNIDVCGGYPFPRDTNLLDAIKNTISAETSQSEVIYPDFAKCAKEEGFGDIEKAFLFCASVENCHKLMLTQIYDKLKSKKLYKSTTPIKWKCGNCGFEHTAKTPWEECPSCNMPQGYVEIPVDVGN